MADTLRAPAGRQHGGGEFPPHAPVYARGLNVPHYFGWSAYVQRPLAVIVLVLVSPILALTMLFTRASSRGPIFYRQRRLGLRGKPFVIYKIRTMRADAEAETGPVWAVPGDDRVTPLGRLLRASHLDELPQLFNVAKGDMALVGPRPERPELVEILRRQVPDYMDRLEVRQGITGLAQVNSGGDVDVESVRRKLVLDLEYIQLAGPLLDLRIICCTLLQVLFLRRPCARLFGVYRHAVICQPEAVEEMAEDAQVLALPSLASDDQRNAA